MGNRDEELKQKILDALAHDTRVDAREIRLRVENGVVYLEGSVDSAAERRAAITDVQSVPGVASVVDYLKLRNYIERSDEELAEAVKQDLIRDPYVDASNIRVIARGGEVILEGRVKTTSERNAAVNVALWTPGVTDVTSRLEVEEEEEEAVQEPVW